MKKKKTRLFFAKLIVALLLTGWLVAFCTLYFVGALSENRTLLFVMLGVAPPLARDGAVKGNGSGAPPPLIQSAAAEKKTQKRRQISRKTEIFSVI